MRYNTKLASVAAELVFCDICTRRRAIIVRAVALPDRPVCHEMWNPWQYASVVLCIAGILDLRVSSTVKLKPRRVIPAWRAQCLNWCVEGLNGVRVSGRKVGVACS